MLKGGTRRRQQSARIAGVLRLIDGAHQYEVLKRVAGSHQLQPYVVLGSALRTLDWTSALPLATLADLPEQVFLFVNRPLECVNHLFIEELVSHALRPDTGLVTGISIDLDGKVLHAGWSGGTEGNLVDKAAGELFSVSTTGKVPLAVRNVETVAEYFFAVRREHLAAVGGLSAIHHGQMQLLADRLASHAATEGLRILVTPDAVATFECHGTEPVKVRSPWQPNGSARVNANPIA